MKLSVVNFVLIFFLLLEIQSIAQKVVLLERPGTVKYHRYEQGDIIAFQSEGADKAGKITMISDSAIQIEGLKTTTKLSGITCVYGNQSYLNKWARRTVGVGLLYFGFSALSGVTANEPQIVSKREAIVSGTIVSVGALMYLIPKRKFKIGTVWRLRVIDFSTETPKG